MTPRTTASLLVCTALTLAACGGSGNGADQPNDGESPRSTASAAPAAEASPLVDPDELTPGGPPPDGIPPIDDPKFRSAADATFLDDTEPVLSVVVGGESKAYPLSIMMWHEIVNDEIGGMPVSVTYCPLCNTGIAFARPVVEGRLLDFGTSGKLYHSNLVMYDRQTETYWAQATGVAIVGPLAGMELEFIPAQILSLEDWKAAYPDGLVLSTDTGFDRDYGVNPYVGYDSSQPFLFEGKVDPRASANERVIGVTVDDTHVAFPYLELSESAVDGWSVQNAEIASLPVAVFWNEGTTSALDEAHIASSRDVGSAVAYRRRIDGKTLTFEVRDGGIVDTQTGSRWSITGEAISGPMRGAQLAPAPAIDSFWFDWAAFHPDTTVFGIDA